VTSPKTAAGAARGQLSKEPASGRKGKGEEITKSERRQVN
jgi:hypothetical protein